LIEGGGVPAYLAYLAGVISFASACVFPIVPPYALIVGGFSLAAREAPRPSGAARYAVLFMVGFVALFVVSGATASLLGSRVREALPAFEAAGAIAVGLVGLALLGIRSVTRSWPARSRSLWPAVLAIAAVFAGAGFAAAWTPCIGPVLAEILLYGSFPETLVEGVVLLSLFSVGLATPFLAIALLVGWAVPRVPAEKPLVGKLLALSLLICSALLLTGRFARVTAYLAAFGPLLDFGI
jgi:cytochrome c-type biogenesis protein